MTAEIQTGVNLNALAQRVHRANEKWWVNLHTGERINRNLGEMLMLVVSELAEAMEGHRKNLMDDKIPHRPMAEVELADAFIRLLDLAGAPEYAPNVQITRRETYIEWTDNFAENLYRLSMTAAYEAMGMPVEFAVNAMIYGIIDLSQREGFDLWGAFEDKMRFNQTRADHTREGRLAEGGKKY